METYAALLRGINVSGQKSLRMPVLAGILEGLGFADVRTYLQSGNAVFRGPAGDARRIAASIEDRIRRDCGFPAETLVLPRAVLGRIASSNPLLPKGAFDESLYHATFLFGPVSEAEFKALTLPAGPGEKAAWGGPVVYLHCPNGYGRTKLNNAYFEKALRVPATTRNWRTVRALQALAAER